MSKSNKKKSSRLPFTERALNNPGDSLVRQIDDLLFEKVLNWLFVSALCVLAAGLEWFRFLRPWPPVPWMMTIPAIVVVGIATYKGVRAYRELQNFRTGLEGEMLVGQKMEELRDAGYKIIHDLRGKGFNVDHVAVGPGGVFVIETKTRRKGQGKGEVKYDGTSVRINGYVPDRDPIKQVLASAVFVRDLVTGRTGLNPPIQPVVVYPGWYVNESKSRPKVWVLNEKRMLGFIRNEDMRLSPQDVTTIASSLAHHVRTSETT